MDKFNVAYEDHDRGITKLYCQSNCDYPTAERMLDMFKRRYLNADGTGKTYPNRKGFYNLSNPRIVRV